MFEMQQQNKNIETTTYVKRIQLQSNRVEVEKRPKKQQTTENFF